MTIIESTPPANTTDNVPTLRSRLPFAVCVLLAGVMMFGNYLLVIPLQFLPGTQQLAQDSLPFQTFWQVLGCSLTLVTALILVGLAARYVLRAPLRRIGLVFTKHSGWLFLLGWAVAAGAMLFSQVITPLLGFDERTPIPPEEWAKLTTGAVVATVIMQVFTGLVLQAIPEELVWRGWLMHCLDQRPRLALAVSAIAFGALHIFSKGGQENLLERIIYVLQAMAFAFVGGVLALRLRSLWAAVGVHAGLHFTNLIFSFTPLNGSGPAIWLTESIVWFALGLLILRGWRGDQVVMDR